MQDDKAVWPKSPASAIDAISDEGYQIMAAPRSTSWLESLRGAVIKVIHRNNVWIPYGQLHIFEMENPLKPIQPIEAKFKALTVTDQPQLVDRVNLTHIDDCWTKRSATGTRTE